jgi:hypothetical protein
VDNAAELSQVSAFLEPASKCRRRNTRGDSLGWEKGYLLSKATTSQVCQERTAWWAVAAAMRLPDPEAQSLDGMRLNINTG